MLLFKNISLDILLLFFATPSLSLVLEFPNEALQKCGHIPASFGAHPKENPVNRKVLKMAYPSHGCGHTVPSSCSAQYSLGPHFLDECSQVSYHDSIVLIDRGVCNFTEKVFWAQSQGAVGVVVMDDVARSVYQYWGVVMSSDPDTTDSVRALSPITIPSIFISFECGIGIKKKLLDCQSDVSMIKDKRKNDVIQCDLLLGTINDVGNELLLDSPTRIEFGMVWLGICAISLTLSSGIWCLITIIQDRIEKQRRLIAIRNLRRGVFPLPSSPSMGNTEGAQYESIEPKVEASRQDGVYEDATCAICLDDYETGDELLVLPCKHCFHGKCVCPWLEERSVCCPLCKSKVIELWSPQWMKSTDHGNDSVPDATLTYLSSMFQPSGEVPENDINIQPLELLTPPATHSERQLFRFNMLLVILVLVGIALLCSVITLVNNV